MPKYFEMEVSLLGIEPRIWRRFLIRAEATFQDLHNAIQEACGWENAHLFEFLSGKGVEVSPPQFTMQKGLERIARSEHAEAFDEEDDVPVAGDIKLLPGTGSNPGFRRIDVDVDTGKVTGLF